MFKVSFSALQGYSYRSFEAGPTKTLPLELNSDPWQGQIKTAPFASKVQAL
jgi:hypothetical protein